MRRAAIVMLAVALVACSAPPKEQSATGSAADRIQAIPAADPYGRVVAVQENSVSSEPERVLIRRNRAIVAGTLEGLHVLINWVPSS